MKTIKFGSVCNVLSGFAFKSNMFGDTGLPIVRIRDVVRGYSETFYSGTYDEKYILKNNDILIGMDGDFNTSYWNGGRALLNQRVCKIEVDPSKVSKKFIYYFLPLALKKIWDETSFVTVKHLSVKKIIDIDLPDVTLETQKQIAAVLEKADQLRKDCQLMEQELNSLTQSVFIDMFGDPVSNSKGWEVKPFSEFITFLRNGISPSKGGQLEFKVLTLSAITQGRYNESLYKLGTFNLPPEKSKKIAKNELLICRGNGNKNLVGCAVYPTKSRDDMVFPDTVIAATFNLEELDITFLNALWSSSLVRTHIESGARTTNGTLKINQTVVNSVPILCPPIAIQQKFGRIVSKINEVIAQNKRQSLECEANFNALMQKAFKGELNLDKSAA